MVLPLRARQQHATIGPYARTDFPSLRDDMTVRQALTAFRKQGVGEKIIYFYVLDDAGQLAGVLPTRRLLTAGPDDRLGDVMIRRVVAIPHTATVLEACEFFVMYKYLAFPVFDDERRVLGVVDAGLFTEEVLDLAEVAERERSELVFEALGFRLSQVRGASPVRAFRYRFPWLLTTIGSGTLCALLVSAYETTLARSLILALFLTMVLGLAESVGIQSMTVTIQTLRAIPPTWRWYRRALGRELPTALLLGLGCGAVVALVVVGWRGEALPAAAIGLGVVAALSGACVFGLTVPAVLHALRLDPKIAAGPVTLACTDLFTLVCYFGLAALLL